MKVLIIDDIELVREAIVYLGKWDMFGIQEIFQASNAKEGLEIIYEKQPEIIITDMKMPIMDGTALLHELEQKHIRSKIIIISGFTDFKYTRLAIHARVVDYILKPIDPQDLNNALASAIHSLEEEYPDLYGESQSSSLSQHPVINDIISYLSRHYKEDISLSDLAGKFYLSKEHLSRLFKKETGQNLFSYIMELKLKEACRLLTETNMTLDDIAYELSFNNGNYFSKVFKKNKGISPKDYRSGNIP